MNSTSSEWPVVTVKSKRCSHCKEVKPAAEFGRCKLTSTGLQSWCNKCQRSRDKVVLLSFECSECHQQCRRRAHSPSKKVRERKICWMCSRRQKLVERGGHPANYTGTKFFSGRMIATWKGSAKKRGHAWTVMNDELDTQYERQQGFCALSGLKMGGDFKSPYRPSIDRIDSKGSYTPENIQFVCSVVNVMKNKIPESDFIRLCGLIAQYRGNAAC